MISTKSDLGDWDVVRRRIRLMIEDGGICLSKKTAAAICQPPKLNEV